MTGDSRAPEQPLRTQESGFGGAAGFGRRPVVLVVDAARAYLDADSPLRLDSGPAAVKAMADLIAAARTTGIPIIYTTVSYPNGAQIDAPVFARKVPALSVFNSGSPLAEIAPAIAPTGEPVITKSYASAFFGTNLAARLSALSADTVVIVGFSTSGCVRATAVDAVQHEFAAVVVADAVADTSAERQRANLYDLNAKYADVISLAQALSALGPRLQGQIEDES
ncbi:isochorismatase family protein [Jatrophihabitans cynanchi]|jgi:maleamate amidohydrolase|uniref:Isochorismatase family protein n=1 Tax=Jatrophihabitans cynanchi TaxID=2944128 RepID=A0ABY7K2C2_9ACTN|nr:isochorismatase family protein [Jatrophihabitans sp. SB3-54]WAX58340.1 isochorismatase family protein [Jatrophihabitans sp. SB3-54]